MNIHPFIISLPVGVLCILSCSDTLPCPDSRYSFPRDEMQSASYRIFAPSGGVPQGDIPLTKAGSLSVEVSSLHLFLFDEAGAFLSHEDVSSSIESGEVSFQYGQGGSGTCLFLANLSSEGAGILEGHSLSEISSGSVPIPLQENFHSPSRLPMGGSAVFPPLDGESGTVTLYRYFSRIRIGKITLDFQDENDRVSEVSLEKIVLTNSCRALVGVKGYGTASLPGNPSFLFGEEVPLGEYAFGGVSSGYIPGAKVSEGGTFEVSSGTLSGEYNLLLNDNAFRSEGVLYTDAVGGLAEMTILFPDSEGTFRSGVPGENASHAPINVPSQPFSVQVDKDLYSLCSEGSDGSIPVYSGYADQTRDPKIVIALSVGGTPRFFPIQMPRLQPGLMYDIPEIILQSSGGTFSNFLTRTVEYSVILKVLPWDEASVESLSSGYGN